MRGLLWLAAVIGLSACAGQQEAPCKTLDCEMQGVIAEVTQACRMDLVRYPRAKRAYIDREYRYPLKNHRSYVSFVNMGGRGPSPRKWCQEYAEQRAQVRLVTAQR